MATLPRALPQSFRDLHFCFRENKFKTAASASFRGVDFFAIFLEALPRSHGELPRKLFVRVAWTYVVCICWWAGHCGTMFLATCCYLTEMYVQADVTSYEAQYIYI